MSSVLSLCLSNSSWEGARCVLVHAGNPISAINKAP